MSNVDEYLKKRLEKESGLAAEARQRTQAAQKILDMYIDFHLGKSTLANEYGVKVNSVSGIHTVSRNNQSINITAASDGIHVSGNAGESVIRVGSTQDNKVEKVHKDITKRVFDQLFLEDVAK